jgi:mercuric ion transport protein
MNRMNPKELTKKWIGAGIVAAIVASLCCIAPVIALLAGTSSMASTFSFLEPARPYLIGLTIALLGFAWYQKLKKSIVIVKKTRRLPSGKPKLSSAL